jgi:hypothetical protein
VPAIRACTETIQGQNKVVQPITKDVRQRGGKMPLQIHAGVVPVGNECYLVARDLRAIYPWDGEEVIELCFPGHRGSTGRTVIVFRDGSKALVKLKPSTVLDRYLEAIRLERAQMSPQAE